MKFHIFLKQGLGFHDGIPKDRVWALSPLKSRLKKMKYGQSLRFRACEALRLLKPQALVKPCEAHIKTQRREACILCGAGKMQASRLCVCLSFSFSLAPLSSTQLSLAQLNSAQLSLAQPSFARLSSTQLSSAYLSLAKHKNKTTYEMKINMKRCERAGKGNTDSVAAGQHG